jgi:hypothetical protein
MDRSGYPFWVTRIELGTNLVAYSQTSASIRDFNGKQQDQICYF